MADRIPGEDRDAGLYVNESHGRMPGAGVTVLRIERDGQPEAWIDAMSFMQVQKERDDLRRTLALINALRTHVGLPITARELLDAAGFTTEDARAMNDIIRAVQADG